MAGPEAAELATHVLEALPRGEYRACLRDGVEVGFAVGRRRLGDWEVGLYPSREHWNAQATLDLLASTQNHFGRPIRRLTITQTHADALGASWPASIHYTRPREQERHIVFFTRT